MVLFGLSSSFASDRLQGDGEETKVHKGKWGDVNDDGKVNWKDLMHYGKKHLDINKDDKIDASDFVAGAKILFGRVHKHFDQDGDGTVTADEIVKTANDALGVLRNISGKIIALSGTMISNSYFQNMDGDLMNSLLGLIKTVNKAAVTVNGSTHTVSKYVGTIGKSLTDVKKNIGNLMDGDISATDIATAQKDIFTYLDMVKGWTKVAALQKS